MKSAVLTITQVARLLRIGRMGCYKAARRGDLPGLIRIGRRLLVSRAALDAWLANPRKCR